MTGSPAPLFVSSARLQQLVKGHVRDVLFPQIPPCGVCRGRPTEGGWLLGSPAGRPRLSPLLATVQSLVRRLPEADALMFGTHGGTTGDGQLFRGGLCSVLLETPGLSPERLYHSPTCRAHELGPHTLTSILGGML